MKQIWIFSVICAVFVPHTIFSATCSRANLTRCLDSACAINVSTNPAARCQYCGTMDAGTPPESKMKSVSVGQSTKNTISDKELKSAPTSPAERYVWASELCLKKVSGCNADDISETYDDLINQSCIASGINMEMQSAIKKVDKVKSNSACNSEISSCMTGDKYCTYDYSGCESDTEFDKFFASCSVDFGGGCESKVISNIRTELVTARDNAIKNRENMIMSIVEAHKNKRANDLKNIQSGCANNSGYEKCMANLCTDKKCSDTTEKSIAATICEYYKIACSKIK